MSRCRRLRRAPRRRKNPRLHRSPPRHPSLTQRPNLRRLASYRYHATRDNPNAARAAATAALVSVEELKPAILTPRDVDFSQITEDEVQVKAEAIAKVTGNDRSLIRQVRR